MKVVRTLRRFDEESGDKCLKDNFVSPFIMLPTIWIYSYEAKNISPR